jgi:hypothetical protein
MFIINIWLQNREDVIPFIIFLYAWIRNSRITAYIYIYIYIYIYYTDGESSVDSHYCSFPTPFSFSSILSFCFPPSFHFCPGSPLFYFFLSVLYFCFVSPSVPAFLMKTHGIWPCVEMLKELPQSMSKWTPLRRLLSRQVAHPSAFLWTCCSGRGLHVRFPSCTKKYNGLLFRLHG